MIVKEVCLMRLNRLFLVILSLSAILSPVWGQVKGSKDSVAAKTVRPPDFDIRDTVSRKVPEAARLAGRQSLERHLANLEALRNLPGGASLRAVPNQYGLPKLLLRYGGVLSAPSD